MPQPYPRAHPAVSSFLGHTDSRYYGFVLAPFGRVSQTNSRVSQDRRSTQQGWSLCSPSQQRVSVCNLYTIYWLLLFLLFYLNAYSPCMLLALAIHSICT